MGRLAICVPTLGHPEFVEEVLEYGGDFIRNHGVDIYYYDSSSDDSTKKYIRKYLRDHQGDNVFYVQLPQNTDYGEKIHLIFSEYGFEKKYDYIWPIKDRRICNEQMLTRILEKCDGKTDAIIPLCEKSCFDAGFEEINHAEEFYEKYAMQITSLEACVYNMRTVLATYNSKEFEGAGQSLRDYWHYFYFFTRLSQINAPRICIIKAKGAEMLTSSHAKAKWSEDHFHVWIDEWIKVNHSLPSLYDPYKEKVIRDTASIEELIGDRGKMMQLHESGYLTPEVFEKYRDSWQEVSYVPTEVIEQIARGEYDPFHDLTIYHAQDDAEKILLKIAQLLSREDQRAGIGDIPLENLKKIVLDRVLHQTRYDQMEALIYGTVLDLFEEYAGTESAERKKKILQTLLLLLR